MKPIVHILGIFATAAALGSCGPEVYLSTDAPVKEVPFTAVHFDDSF